MGYQSPVGGQITAADTNAHPFPVTSAGVVYFQTPAANTGTVTITDAVNGAGGLALPAGIGVSLPIIAVGPLESLASLTYQFSVGSGDKLNYLVLR